MGLHVVFVHRIKLALKLASCRLDYLWDILITNGKIYYTFISDHVSGYICIIVMLQSHANIKVLGLIIEIEIQL